MSVPLPIHARAFVPATDLDRLGAFLAATTVRCSAYAFPHPGNLWWSMFYTTAVDPVRSARIWEDAAGAVRGLAWLDDGELIMHVDPVLRGSGLLEDQMLMWAETQTAQHTADAAVTLSTPVASDDLVYARLLEHRGYRRHDDAFVLLERTLGASLPTAFVPPGVTVRPVAHPQDDQARVDAHRDAFAPSSFSLAAYQRLQQAPGYVVDLDLVAVLADGRVGAYGLVWWEPTSKRGLFEPIGTREALQRQGLGRAVMVAGLERLHAYGATTAAVGTAAGHTAAIRLYEAVGMREVKRGYNYRKEIAADT